MNIWPKEKERAFFVGKTRSGKTYAMLLAMRRFINQYQIQVLETKGDEQILNLGYPIVSKLKDVTKYKFPEYPVVVYAPRGNELADKVSLDSWCEWIYQRGNTVAVIDELTQLVSSTHAPAGFLDLYTRGRTHGDTVLAGNQRPRGVPAIVYTEAEHYYKFRLNDLRDRKRIADFTHPIMERQVRDEHGFHYYTVNSGEKVFYVKSL